MRGIRAEHTSGMMKSGRPMAVLRRCRWVTLSHARASDASTAHHVEVVTIARHGSPVRGSRLSHFQSLAVVC